MRGILQTFVWGDVGKVLRLMREVECEAEHVCGTCEIL